MIDTVATRLIVCLQVLGFASYNPQLTTSENVPVMYLNSEK